MKFCEKLARLRKNNNLSQEQLADKLGVSRQAVSKWESGLSIPDMEKIMQLCKILNCSLDELVDDGVGGNKKQLDGKMNWNDFYKEVLDFITKTFNMFWSMRLIEKVKCFLEMLFLALLLWFIWAMIGNVVHLSFNPILSLLPKVMYSFIQSIISFIYRIFGIVISFVLLVHIFKIRYLDYFITIEDMEATEKKMEVPIEEENKHQEETRTFIEKKKNKIIIRDPKHSSYGFFGIFARVVIWFIKGFVILFSIPCIICFIGITFASFCSLFYIKDGLFFLGLLLALLGCLIINYLVLKFIYYFVFELKYPFKKMFVGFIMGLILIGGGSGVSFCNYLTFDELDFKNISDKTTTIEEIEYEDRLVLSFMNLHSDDVKIVEDNSRENIKLEIEHLNFLECSLYAHNRQSEENYKIYELSFYDNHKFVEEVNFLLDMVSNKKRLEFNDNQNYQVTIYASHDIMEKIKDNYYAYYE